LRGSVNPSTKAKASSPSTVQIVSWAEVLNPFFAASLALAPTSAPTDGPCAAEARPTALCSASQEAGTAVGSFAVERSTSQARRSVRIVSRSAGATPAADS
jgi:hypothetical protein